MIPRWGKDTCMTTNEAMMAISDKLSKIKHRAASLNHKTDQLNATIERIEKELQGAGVEFWWSDGPQFDVREFEGGEERLYAVLGYAKVNTEWHIAVEDQREAFGESGWAHVGSEDPVPLVRASRSIRLAVAPELEAFLDAFDNAIATMETKVDKANALVTDDASARVDQVSADMERLRRALKTPGERVEIDRHVGYPSGSLAAANESSAEAARLNAQGSRVARIFSAKGRAFECRVSAEQARELLTNGASERK